MPPQRGPKVRLEVCEGRIWQLTLGKHDDIEAKGRFVEAEDLTYQPLGPIAARGIAESTRRDDSETADPEAIALDDQRHVPAARPDTLVLHPLKLWTPPKPLIASESLRHERC